MTKGGNSEFGRDLARMHPVILREAVMKQMPFFSKSGLSIQQVVVADLLREKGPSRMGEIAKALNLSMGAATAVIDKMIAGGLVKRDHSAEDRRVVTVALLMKGSETITKIEEERVRVLNDIFSVLSAGEKEEYLRLIRKVYKAVKAD
jgi:DNA-binding MarR family transcriptional regulator